jgi:5-methylcytosine-specific restriction protein B
VQAWRKVNDKISLGRGAEFQIGHGVLFGDIKIDDIDVAQALNFVSLGWGKIRSHIEEVFFGDMRGVAAVLNAIDGPDYGQFKLEETEFAGELRYRLNGPSTINTENIYLLLRALIAS